MLFVERWWQVFELGGIPLPGGKVNRAYTCIHGGKRVKGRKKEGKKGKKARARGDEV